MRFIGATHDVVYFECEIYTKETRFFYDDEYGSGSDPMLLDGSSISHNYNCETYPIDGVKTNVHYYLLPGNQLITDKDKIDILNEQAHHKIDYYIIEHEWCLKDADGNIIRVMGYEKRRECDDQTILYEEWWIKNAPIESDYKIGDTLFSLDGFEKTRCLRCCGGTLR